MREREKGSFGIIEMTTAKRPAFPEAQEEERGREAA